MVLQALLKVVLIFFIGVGVLMFQGLKVIDFQMSDFMRVLESAIQYGLPVLLQNVGDKLDASLDPILNKSVIRIGLSY